MEVVMKDGTRCDILTATHAIEVDFAKKWAEAIGQSLNYAMQTGKRPATSSRSRSGSGPHLHSSFGVIPSPRLILGIDGLGRERITL